MLAQWCKQSVRLAGVGVALLMLFILAPSAALGDVEPNDGITQAEGPLMAGLTYEGTLANEQDKDTYLFYVPRQQQLTVQVRETKRAKDEAYDCLYSYFGDSDNEMIAYESEGAADFRYTTPPGVNRFYLSIYSPYECEGGNSYSVRIEPAGALVTGPTTLSRVPTTEPNEDNSHALGALLGNTAYTGEIQTQNDEDWFKFYTAPGTHQVDVAVTPISELCSESEGAGSVEGPGLSTGLAFGSDSYGRGQSIWHHAHFTSSTPGVYYIHFGTGEVFGGSSHCLGSAYEFVIEPPDAITMTSPGTASRKMRRGYVVAERIARFSHHRARVRLWCKGAGNCRGSLKLIARASGRRISIGHARFSFGQRRSLILRVRISREGSRLLGRARRGRLPVKLSGRGVKSRSVALVAGRHRAMHAPPSAASRIAGRVAITMYDGFRFVTKPKTLDTRKMGLFDETVLVAKNLHWRHWGAKKAVAVGRITYCVTGYVPCRTRDGRVVLQGRFLGRCGYGDGYHYKTIRWHARGVNQKADLFYETQC